MTGVVIELVIELAVLALVAVPDGLLFCMIEKTEGTRKKKYQKIRTVWEVLCLIIFFFVIYLIGTSMR